MSELLSVGELPEVLRSPGRKPGKWGGHEAIARELIQVASRRRIPANRWGQVAEQLTAAKSQSIAAAIKKGQAVGFEPTEDGCFEAAVRKSKDQSDAVVDAKGKKQVLYDVYARWAPRETE